VDAQNVTEVVDAGVEWVVAGTSIFHSVNPRAAYEEMRSLAQNASAVKV
jgi:thiamine monophosphate synthase